jgi:acetamidase/formamidase
MKRLSLNTQGKLNYAISRFNEPKLRIDPGETILVETEDAWSGQVRKKGDRRDYSTMPFGNPQSGPIYVNGAEEGDSLAVRINDIKPTIDKGFTRTPPYWWYIGSTESAALEKFLQPSLAGNIRLCPIHDGRVYFSDEYTLPYQPFIGTIGTAPALESISSGNPGNHGGNMDLPDVCVGNTIYLPVYVDGALLHLGDVHAIQGDGEITGSAVEMPSECNLTIGLLKKRTIPLPRIESEEHIMAVASSGIGRSLQDAIRIAYIQLVFWMEEDFGFNRSDAFQLCAQVGKLRLGNLWAVAAKFPKEHLI